VTWSVAKSKEPITGAQLYCDFRLAMRCLSFHELKGCEQIECRRLPLWVM
jgi:hypothetical protein